jgi:hypothetical protein
MLGRHSKGKMIARAAACALVLTLGAGVASAGAHGGGLDADGCHTNRKTGDYHCHRGGGAKPPSARVQPLSGGGRAGAFPNCAAARAAAPRPCAGPSQAMAPTSIATTTAAPVSEPRRWALPCAAALSLMWGAGGAQAQSSPPPGPYTYELPKLYPLAAARWREILPEPMRATPWLATFNGVSAPVRPIVVGDAAMVYAWACRPHDCDRNNLNLLVSADQRRVVGIVRWTTDRKAPPAGSGERHTSLLIVGEPTGAELTCLRALERRNTEPRPQDSPCR